MVPGFHGFDLIILLAIVLLIFGPKKLPEIGSAIGKSFKEYRKSMSELNAPEEEEVKTLSAPGKADLEDKHASAKAATEAVSSAESEAERH
jgi:sec-independent protein translocase protein TatA